MNTRVLVTLSLFIGIGAAMHAIIPGFFFGMKPDMMPIMMFLGILLFPEKRNVLLLGIVTGIISGLTTTFPGGLIPNMIDKPITAFLFFGLLIIFKKRRQSVMIAGFLTTIGTLISGVVFLTVAFFLVGLPTGTGFAGLLVAVVLPATILNTVAMVIIYPIILSIVNRTDFVSVSQKRA